MATNKRKTYYVAGKIEVDDQGNFSADVRQISESTLKTIPFDSLGLLLWSERITSYLVKGFIDSKLKLFK